MSLNEISRLKNLVRIGTVSSVDVEKVTARVKFADKQDVDGSPLISAELKVLQTTSWIPDVGQLVVCLYLPNGDSEGFVLGYIGGL